MRNTRISLLTSLMGAASIAFAVDSLRTVIPRRGLRGAFRPQPAKPARSRSRRYPQMVTSSDEAIALHNATASSRQVRRSYIVRQDRALRRTVIANAGGIRQYKLQRRARRAA